MTTEKKIDIRSLTMKDLQAVMEQLQQPKFRAKQIYHWLWKKSATSFTHMKNLPADLVLKLQEKYAINNLKIDQKQISNDGTIKLGFKLYDEYLVEGVLIPADDRMTACVSSQVGCSLSCKFCATGYISRKRNLNFDEIYDQVVLIQKEAKEQYGKELTNIVFMGMGEPLLNYKNLLAGIDKITAADGLAISPKRITVSTVGISKMIQKLADDQVKFRLALSLHAADDKKRSEIMPINDQNSLHSLQEALKYFYDKTKTKVTFEYILFDQFNDTEEDAIKLAAFCKDISSKVNIIEYNPIEQASFKKPDRKRLDSFNRFLINQGVFVSVRQSRGKDIDAACGQLANKKSIST